MYNHAKISVNNEYWGIYLALEAVEESFMLRADRLKGQLEGTTPSTAQGQKVNSSLLVDASYINLSDLGQFNMGGGGLWRWNPTKKADTIKK